MRSVWRWRCCCSVRSRLRSGGGVPHEALDPEGVRAEPATGEAGEQAIEVAAHGSRASMTHDALRHRSMRRVESSLRLAVQASTASRARTMAASIS